MKLQVFNRLPRAEDKSGWRVTYNKAKDSVCWANQRLCNRGGVEQHTGEVRTRVRACEEHFIRRTRSIRIEANISCHAKLMIAG